LSISPYTYTYHHHIILQLSSRLLYYHYDREYFNNRAAAQAVKAKVEAYERHGIDRFNQGGAVAAGGGGGGGMMVPLNPSPLVRRNSDSSREQQQQQSQYNINNGPMSNDYSAKAGRRSSYDGDIDPEARIALIKQQKERERDRENALKEIEVCMVDRCC